MSETVNTIPIFVSSADSYADIWPAFFALLKREWPEYKGTIYLNTETLDYTHEGLNIVCTKLGKQKRFGESFRRGIDCVPCERFLLLMIDYFIEGKVNVLALQQMYDAFVEDDADTFTLITQPFGFKPIESRPRYSYIDIKEGWKIMFSFQAGFWKKSSLKKIVVPWEDPWRAEWLGSRRAAAEGMKFYLIPDRNIMPIKYDEAGVLHGGGKWLKSAISRIDLTGIPLDLKKSKRAVYEPSANPALNFIKEELRVAPLKIRSWLAIMAKHPKATRYLLADLRQRFSALLAILKGKPT